VPFVVSAGTLVNLSLRNRALNEVATWVGDLDVRYWLRLLAKEVCDLVLPDELCSLRVVPLQATQLGNFASAYRLLLHHCLLSFLHTVERLGNIELIAVGDLDLGAGVVVVHRDGCMRGHVVEVGLLRAGPVLPAFPTAFSQRAIRALRRFSQISVRRDRLVV